MNAMSMRRTAGTAVVASLAAMMMLAAVVAMPLVAAAETFTVELEKQIIRGAPGEAIDLGTFPTPASLVGDICTVEAIGNNNESVHIGNNIEVTSANTVTLIGVEDASDKDTFANGPLTLSETVGFTLILGQDPIFSAEFQVTFDCAEVEETTTTTVADTTTTTVADTTTTTVAETTSTTVQVTTTSTLAPTTTTTVGQTATTSPPEVQATTTVPSTLPFTGVESDHLAIVAFLALAAGSGLVLMTRQNSETRGDGVG